MNQLGKVLKAALAVTVAAAMLVGSGAFAAEKQPREVKITVTEKGYEPSQIKVKKGEPLKLLITRKTEHTCANEILIKDTSINVPLPLNTEVAVAYTPQKSGEIKYGCAMGMMVSGVLLVE